uniref:CBM20 domain-containing protein n=2 Tax=Globisporangium ultimum (strain ATCC 200006 / CBS 805.95 / DAOM BR144) TaxID=431595 RepID=K3W8D4_GLOUD
MLQRLRHAVGWGLPAPPPGTRIDFQVCAPLGHGQTLYIVGDIPILGGSIECSPNPNTASTSGGENGLALVTTPDLYPIWYNLEPIVVPAGSMIRYRYAVGSGSRFLRYENISSGARELVVGMDYLQAQDTLDSLAHAQGATETDLQLARGDGGSLWGIIPRLSSGQAFVDRRALDNDESGAGNSWGKSKLSSGTKRLSGRGFAEAIAEESANAEDDEDGDVTMTTPTADDALPPRPPPRSMSRNLSLSGLSGFASSGGAADYSSSRMIEGADDSKMQCYSPVLSRARSYSDDSVKSPQNVTIESTDGVIIVVYRLPVLVKRTPEGEYLIEWEDDNLVCPSGLMKDANSDSHFDRVNSMRLTWVGTVHCSSTIPREDEECLARQLEAFHCVPVFLNKSLADTFHSFCYGTLWPIFHNIVDVYGRLPTRWWNPNQQKNAWSSYKNVNRIFVNKVIEVYNEGDLVWVHGLHLLVAPSFLSRRLPSVNVGLFLHTPFPSSEIFRTLSVRSDLLRGMLSADHIGFHLYEHARHFLTSCRRILGLKYSAQPGGYIGIEYSGRIVMLTISHIGIEPPFLEMVSQSAQVAEDTRQLLEKYEADRRKVIVSVDRVERLKGILLKLGAIEQFLQTNPEWVEKLQVVQIGIIDTSNPSPEKKGCQVEIQGYVKHLNEVYSKGRKEPIIAYFEVENTDLASRLPLWRVGDILLTTSVRDAVNLYPFEFIYAHELEKKPGVVVVSEFSGSSRVLTGSIGVNPWKREEIVRAIELSVTMSEEERVARHNKDLEYIVNNSRTKWAERILVDLKRTKKYAAGGEHTGYGLGLGFRMLEFNAGFKMLESDAVAKAYRTSFRRVILLDYGNTLTQNEQGGANDFSKYLNCSSDAATSDPSVLSKTDTPAASPELLSALSLLCADPRNTVFVLSGKERADLENTLGSVRGLGLAAEHGYLYKWGDSKNGPDSDDVWLCTKDNFDDSWKDVTHSVMDIYTQRTHGTYIELKGSALLWQFRDADPEFGQLQAKELHDQLNQVLEHFHVEVITGTDYLEVRPEGVDKGVIVDRIMSTLESQGNNYVDFILCVGDDSSDEFMFQYLEDMRSRSKLFTVTVGKKPSAAKYFVNDVDQVMEVLHSLTKLSTVANRNLSMNDLRLLDRNRPTTSDLLSFSNRLSGTGSDYRSEGSFEGISSSPFSSLTASAPSSENGGRSLKTAKYSMSMSSLSSVANSFPTTSATYEQYFSNIDESEEDDQGGIFF